MPARFKLARLADQGGLADRRSPELVPREILTRRKMGFPVPVGGWLRGGFSSVVDEFVMSERAVRRGLFERATMRRLVERHRTGAAEHGDRLWLLANFEIWQRMFVDGESKQDVLRDVRDKCALAA